MIGCSGFRRAIPGRCRGLAEQRLGRGKLRPADGAATPKRSGRRRNRDEFRRRRLCVTPRPASSTVRRLFEIAPLLQDVGGGMLNWRRIGDQFRRESQRMSRASRNRGSAASSSPCSASGRRGSSARPRPRDAGRRSGPHQSATNQHTASVSLEKAPSLVHADTISPAANRSAPAHAAAARQARQRSKESTEQNPSPHAPSTGRPANRAGGPIRYAPERPSLQILEPRRGA